MANSKPETLLASRCGQSHNSWLFFILTFMKSMKWRLVRHIRASENGSMGRPLVSYLRGPLSVSKLKEISGLREESKLKIRANDSGPSIAQSSTEITTHD